MGKKKIVFLKLKLLINCEKKLKSQLIEILKGLRILIICSSECPSFSHKHSLLACKETYKFPICHKCVFHCFVIIYAYAKIYILIVSLTWSKK